MKLLPFFIAKSSISLDNLALDFSPVLGYNDYMMMKGNEMTAVKNVRLGDRVRYESAAGDIRGTVVNILLDQNAAGNLIPWLHIMTIRNNRECIIPLAGTETNLAMMKFKVCFRDVA